MNAVTDDFSAQPPRSCSASSYAGRDRALLYTRGMDLSPEDGVALALRGIRQAKDSASPDMVMQELFHILEDNGFPEKRFGADGLPLVSAPSMNRRPMIAEEMESLSICGAVAAFFRKRIAAAMPARFRKQ